MDDVCTSDDRHNDDVTNGEGGSGQCNGSCTTQDGKKITKSGDDTIFSVTMDWPLENRSDYIRSCMT